MGVLLRTWIIISVSLIRLMLARVSKIYGHPIVFVFSYKAAVMPVGGGLAPPQCGYSISGELTTMLPI